MATEHYFSESPLGDFTPRTITVTLAGKERTLSTAGSVFSPEHLDEGTAALLRYAPEPPATGNILDLGCGWGPIALHAALLSPEATVWAVDVNERALELTRRNAESLGLTNVRAVTASEVPEDIRFAQVLSNPPIRVGKVVLHDLLSTWLPRLEADGDAFLVVAKHLGAESLQKWLSSGEAGQLHAERFTNHKGFRVLRVTPTI